MPTSVTPPPAVSRYATIGLVTLISIIAAGVVFKVNKQTPTVAIRQEYIIEAKSSSGSSFVCDGFASCAMSGSLTVDGVKISTGSLVTFSTAEGIYVNQAGDTMTGALRINLSSGFLGLRVNQTASGAHIHAEQGLTSSGSITAEGTISGSVVRAVTFSGTYFRGIRFSPRTLEIGLFSTGSTVATGSGKGHVDIPKDMSGYNLTNAFWSCDTAGTTGITSLQIRDKAKNNRKFFSTPISIDSTENDSTTAATPYVINASNDDVGAYDKIIFDTPAVSTTAPKSCNITLDFSTP